MSSPAYQRRRIGRRVLALLAAGLVVAGCAGVGGAGTIDGWPIGPLESCPEPNVPNHQPAPGFWDCAAALAQWLAAATEGFEERNPGHAPIVRTTLYKEGTVRDLAGNEVLVTRSGAGCCRVAVFELADGSVHAIGVGHMGVETEHLQVIYEGP